ncbi:MAG: hydroxyacid dehydrogenase [Caldimonas sp.]
MARIVIAEFMDERAVAHLAAVHSVCHDAALVDDMPRLLREAATADALVVRNRTQVRGALLEAMVRCRAVGRLGVGLDNIDVEACTARGIEVIPATGANALSVAEYVIAAAMLLLRGAYGSTAAVAGGGWPRVALSGGREIAGKTLGLVGFGSIGQLVAKLGAGLGMRVVAFDPALPPSAAVYAAAGVVPIGLAELVATSDVVSLHVPSVEATRGLFDSHRIAAMKRGAILVNTARGGIVDEPALAAALRSGHLGGAAVDVFAHEPFAAGSAFEGCPNLLLTPHVAGVTLEANERVSTLVASKLLEALR